MTPEEQQMLNDLASKIAEAPAPAIDPDADQLIRTKIGSRPDALYVLTQTVLIQNMAIDHAQQQIRDLQQHAAQNPAPQPGSSFLPQSRPWTVPGYSAPPPPPAAPVYSAPPPAYATPPPGYATPPPAYATPQPMAPPSSGHSFLRTAAITAGGVAAGALAFEGIKSLFGGGGYSHPQSGFLGGGGAGMIPGLGPGMAPSETIVNNYYDSPQHGGRDDLDSPRSLRDDDDDRAPRDDDDRSSSDDDSSSLDDSSSSDDSSSGDDFA